MRMSTLFPIESPAFQSQEALVKAAQLLERLGFDNTSVTDHPCPTGRWLDAGGHHAQDPFVVLSLIAGVTRKLKLQTGILVLPYRNPFITARAVSTLDVLSGGRVLLGMGAGYMKGEYFALGVDFEKRNELMDEYLRAMKAAWGANEFSFDGTGYSARGNRILPRPVQQPHPPLWLGGNSKRAIRRAVEHGDAWYPFFTAPMVAQTSRTIPLTNEAELADGIKYMREYSEQVGRKQPPEVVTGGLPGGGAWNANAILDKIGKLRDLGVTATAVRIDGHSLNEWLENAERAGVEVLAKLPKTRAAE